MKPQARGHVEENPQVPVTSDMSRDSGTSTTARLRGIEPPCSELRALRVHQRTATYGH